MTMQRTMEWHQMRLGKPTASRFGDIRPGRGGNDRWSQATHTYMRELLVERLTGIWSEAYGAAIDWGNDYEDDAREAYTAWTGNQVRQEAFAEKDGIGGSPDGLIGELGCIEIKCPYNSANHINYKLEGCGQHMAQIQANIYFNNRKWCDFVSYDPRMPEELQLIIIRIERDDTYIDAMIAQVHAFADDLDELERRVRG